MRRSCGRLFLLLVSAALTAPALASDTAQVPLYPPYVYPPWQKDADSDVAERGLEFTVPEVDNLPDFHGRSVPPFDRHVMTVIWQELFPAGERLPAIEAGAKRRDPGGR
jgi:hypothetical protein